MESKQYDKGLWFFIGWIFTLIGGMYFAAVLEPNYPTLASLVGYGLVFGGMIFWGTCNERARKKFEIKERQKKYHFDQEVIKEQARIQAEIQAEVDAQVKAEMENEMRLRELANEEKRLFIEKNKITDFQKEQAELKRKELNQKERELQIKEDEVYDLKDKIEELEEKLATIYETEIWKLGSQTLERNKMTANLKKFILERDDYTCQACGASLHNDFNLKLEVDHIVPISKGGKTDPSNLQTLCRKCNRSKGAKPMEVFVGAK